MIIAIASPSNPLLPPAANRLMVIDTWSSSLGNAPLFSYKIQNAVAGKEGDVVTDLKFDVVAMTMEQWNNWQASDNDEQYILKCLLANLGLSPA